MSKRLSLSLSLSLSRSLSHFLIFAPRRLNVYFAKLSVLFDNINHVDPLNEMKYFYVIRTVILSIILFFLIILSYYFFFFHAGKIVRQQLSLKTN